MKTLVLKLDLHDQREKQKAMAKVSGISGVISVTIDMKEKKMTVTGEVDAVDVTRRLRKICHADIMTVGEAKKEEKKDEGEKEGDNKKPDIAELERLYRLHNPYIYYPVMSVEESPNSCVIC